jgi:hypothetical protein
MVIGKAIWWLFTRSSPLAATAGSELAMAGGGLSRHEGKFTASAEQPLEMAELLAAMGAQANITARDRQDAIACFLSAGEGWRDALDVIGGAFAPDLDSARLREAKEE